MTKKYVSILDVYDKNQNPPLNVSPTSKYEYMNLFDNIVNRPILPQYAQEKFRATSSQINPTNATKHNQTYLINICRIALYLQMGRTQCKIYKWE